jgi:phosphoribosylformylglycinamidine synthase
MKANVFIRLKTFVTRDPHGKGVEMALSQAGITGVNEIRQGKFIEVDVDIDDPAIAEQRVKEMCEGLLAHSVIEDYEIEMEI